MSANLNKVEKKLAQLRAAKAKEESKSKENIEKLTKKYNEDAKLLKANFDKKVAESKDDLASKLSAINPEIDFFEKRRKAIIELEEKMEAEFKKVDERSGGKPSKEDDEEPTPEESSEYFVEQ